MKKIIVAVMALMAMSLAACHSNNNTNYQLTPDQQQLFKGGN